MSSHDDDNVAGPSGLSHHESLKLLGLDISDSEDDTNSCVGPLICTENMADSDDNICQEALDQWEQSGGGLDPSAQVTFQFDLEPFVNRKSDRMGVQERHFKTQLRQKGELDSGSKHYPSSPRWITSSRRSSVNHHPRPPRSRSPLLYNSIRSPAQ